MINLLPYADKKELEREKMRRFLAVALLGVSTLFALGLFLMAPIYFSLTLQKKNLLEELSLASKNAPLERLGELEREIKNLNSKLLVLEEGSRKEYLVSEVFREALGLRSAGIELRHLSFHKPSGGEAGRLNLGGRAQRREDLQTFIQALERSESFKKINSPVSNLLKKTEVEFSLELEL